MIELDFVKMIVDVIFFEFVKLSIILINVVFCLIIGIGEVGFLVLLKKN